MQTVEVSSHPVMEPASPTFLSCITKELWAVEVRLGEGLESRSTLARKAAHYILTSQGKRMRPALLLLAAKLCGDSTGNRHIDLALAAEYIHAATLVHDDIIDHSETRRGQPSAHAKWGTQLSVLIGDFLYSQAIQMLVKDGDLQVLEAFSEATTRMSEGEVMELEMTNNLKLSRDDYLTIATFKTATLLSAASRAGGLITQTADKNIDALTSFGLNLGIGFQLIDDALDFTGHPEILGKPVGQDIKERKITLPIIHTVQHGSVDTQMELQRIFDQESLNDQACAQVADLVIRSDGVAATLDIARGFLEMAKSCLQPFPPSPFKEALLAVADYVQRRTC